MVMHDKVLKHKSKILKHNFKEIDKLQEDKFRVNLKTYNQEELIKLLQRVLQQTSGQPDLSENNCTGCELKIDIWEKHGLNCSNYTKQYNKLGSINFPACNMNSINDEPTKVNQLNDDEPGIIIKKSLKGMFLNNPEMFGITINEKNNAISGIPILDCHCNNCLLTKFSIVESKCCICKDTEIKQSKVKESDIENEIVKYGDFDETTDGRKKKKSKKWGCFGRKK